MLNYNWFKNESWKVEKEQVSEVMPVIAITINAYRCKI